ncbi:MAG: hypothetical protein IJ866_03325 [Alphaproteobacteria bacterium]|nr:hypothetical protein [Alphaproteobacteria bacterium]
MLHRQIFEWCPTCQDEASKKEEMPPYQYEQIKRKSLWNNATDEFQVEEFKCPKGHITVGIHQNFQYEFLLDMALEDLLNCNFRGAFFNFASAEERFFEFFIEVICIKHNISLEAFDETWKIIGNLSERQYGAFSFLYLLEFGISPIDISRKQIENKRKNKKYTVKELRNKVIHQGYKPTEKEAKDYGNAVISNIRNIVAKLKDSADSAIIKMTHKKLKLRTEEVNKLYKNQRVNIATICGGGICSNLFASKPQEISIDKLLEEMKKDIENNKRHYNLD